MSEEGEHSRRGNDSYGWSVMAVTLMPNNHFKPASVCIHKVSKFEMSCMFRCRACV